MPPRLPYELLGDILSLVSDSDSLPGDDNPDAWRSMLISFALACKDFRDLAYPHLFRSVAFVFVKDLTRDRSEVQSFPAPYRRKRQCFYRYIKNVEDIISLYLSGRDGIISSIRQLSLHMDHHQLLEDKPLGSLSYRDFVRIVKPLENIQHIGLIGLVLEREDIAGPILLPSLTELVIDHEMCFFHSQTDDSIRISPADLYFLFALFGEIRHLVVNYVTMHDSGDIRGLVCPTVHSVTMGCNMHSGSAEGSFLPLQFVPVESLRALHLTGIQTSTLPRSSNVVSLSRFLTRIGPALEHLTVGAVCLGNDAFLGYNNFPNNFLSIDFRPCVRLHTVGIIIRAPWADEYTGDAPGTVSIRALFDVVGLILIVKRVVLQSLPPSVKTLKLTLRELLVLKLPSQETAAEKFWEILEASLNTLLDKGVERVEIITLKDSVGATPCTEIEQECLKAYFPRLVQRGVLFFPEDTFSHHSGRYISDLFTCNW